MEDFLIKNENGRTQGLLIWSFFTAIMIIVVSAAVLKFVFGVDFSGKTINETAKMKENNIKYCPHGRPVYVIIKKSDIEKKFFRK